MWQGKWLLHKAFLISCYFYLACHERVAYSYCDCFYFFNIRAGNFTIIAHLKLRVIDFIFKRMRYMMHV